TNISFCFSDHGFFLINGVRALLTQEVDLMTHFKKSCRLIAYGEKSQAWYKNQACQSLKDIEEILKKVMHRWIL
ncbi:hypothetical protein, partial [Serratia nevei]|uniref:hypothetical protein n=1 Tax=Serratia nevei TaxID=2703794 RepID=UPI002AA0E46E